MAGGSISTASVCTVVAQACDSLRMRLGQDGKPAADIAAAMKDRGMGALEDYAESIPYGVAKDGVQALYRGAAMPMGGARLKDRIQFAFGAQFVEVRIHARTREIRVPRMVGAFASGRILNPRTAHSQYMGGMIWGIGSAIHEQTEIDPRASRYVNANLADYMIPVNADVGEVHVIMIPEEDTVDQSAGRQRHWRDRHRRDLGGAGQCDLPRDRPAVARLAAADRQLDHWGVKPPVRGSMPISLPLLGHLIA